MIRQFSRGDFEELCDKLVHDEPVFGSIISAYGYPPFWSRPNTFESLVQIILEQQVSLASAKAAYDMLKKTIGDVTPESILAMTDDQFKQAYFSRQKKTYVQELARSIQAGSVDLDSISDMRDENVRKILIKEKGVGNWTIDVYMIEVLHRLDIFPPGDIAAVRAVKDVYGVDRKESPEEFEALVELWAPYRTIATMLLWHHYLSSRGRSEEMLAST